MRGKTDEALADEMRAIKAAAPFAWLPERWSPQQISCRATRRAEYRRIKWSKHSLASSTRFRWPSKILASFSPDLTLEITAANVHFGKAWQKPTKAHHLWQRA
ncbi:MAG: hypothetical protein ACJAVR_001431 [Paracoccaceae bacterium]